MDIIGDRSAKSDKLGSWSYRKEPSLRYEHPQNSREAHTALGTQESRAWIKGDEVRERGCFNERVVVVEAAIPVASPEPVWEDAALIIGKGERARGRRDA
jgi:hypothetical protein